MESFRLLNSEIGNNRDELMDKITLNEVFSSP